MTASIFNITERNEESEVTGGSGSLLIRTESEDTAYRNLFKRKSILSQFLKSIEDEDHASRSKSIIKSQDESYQRDI